MADPIIRPFKTYSSGGTKYRIQAHGGLHHLRGNARPYFSLTATQERQAGNGRWLEDSGGAMHEEILRHWPELADLAALHLSDPFGVPSGAAENAFYWIAGAAGGWGTQYHGGNSSGTPWTAAQCLQTFADHVRVSLDEARAVLEMVEHAADHLGPYSRVWTGDGIKARKEAVDAWCDAQRPRWLREAAECIERHGLQTYS